MPKLDSRDIIVTNHQPFGSASKMKCLGCASVLQNNDESTLGNVIQLLEDQRTSVRLEPGSWRSASDGRCSHENKIGKKVGRAVGKA